MAAIHSDEFKRDAVRIALTSGLTRRQGASDLGVGHSTLGKWIRVFSEETKAPAPVSASRAVFAKPSLDRFQGKWSPVSRSKAV
jgi:transposase-like protein